MSALNYVRSFSIFHLIQDDTDGSENANYFNLQEIISIKPSNGILKPYSETLVEISLLPTGVSRKTEIILYTQFSMISSAGLKELTTAELALKVRLPFNEYQCLN
jgi:hypothetical protein